MVKRVAMGGGMKRARPGPARRNESPGHNIANARVQRSFDVSRVHIADSFLGLKFIDSMFSRA